MLLNPSCSEFCFRIDLRIANDDEVIKLKKLLETEEVIVLDDTIFGIPILEISGESGDHGEWMEQILLDHNLKFESR